MLLHRYSSIEYIMQLPPDTGLALLEKAREQEADARYHIQWAVQLPYMSEETFLSFADYKARLTGADIDTRPTAEILAELDELEKRMGKEAGDGDI